MTDEKLSYTIMVDPAGLDWEKTTPGLLFAVQSWAKMLGHMNPEEDDRGDDSLEDLLRVMWPSLRLISDELISRMDPGRHLVKQVREQIAGELDAGEGGES